MKAWHWLALKTAIIAMMIYFPASSDGVQTGMSVLTALMISAVVFLVFSTWLVWRRRSEPDIDWSISFSGRFWPMRQYPLQFLALASIAGILGGGVSILRARFVGHGNIADGAIFLFIGVAVALAIILSLAIKQGGRKHGRGM